MPGKDETSPALNKKVEEVLKGMMTKVEQNVKQNFPPHVDMAALNVQLKRLTKLVEAEKLAPEAPIRKLLNALERRKNIVVEQYAALDSKKKDNESSNAERGLSTGTTPTPTNTQLSNEKKTDLRKGSKSSFSRENLEEKKEKLKEQNQRLYDVEGMAQENPREFNNFKRLQGLYERKKIIYGIIASIIPTLNPDLVIKRLAGKKPQSQEFDQLEEKIKNFQVKFEKKQLLSPKQDEEECKEMIIAIHLAIQKAEKQDPELAETRKKYVSNEAEIKEIEKMMQKQALVRQARDIGKRSLDHLMKEAKGKSNIIAPSSVPQGSIAPSTNKMQHGH